MDGTKYTGKVDNLIARCKPASLNITDTATSTDNAKIYPDYKEAPQKAAGISTLPKTASPAYDKYGLPNTSKQLYQSQSYQSQSQCWGIMSCSMAWVILRQVLSTVTFRGRTRTEVTACD